MSEEYGRGWSETSVKDQRLRAAAVQDWNTHTDTHTHTHTHTRTHHKMRRQATKQSQLSLRHTYAKLRFPDGFLIFPSLLVDVTVTD